jgi:hypothetical protein
MDSVLLRQLVVQRCAQRMSLWFLSVIVLVSVRTVWLRGLVLIRWRLLFLWSAHLLVLIMIVFSHVLARRLHSKIHLLGFSSRTMVYLLVHVCVAIKVALLVSIVNEFIHLLHIAVLDKLRRFLFEVIEWVCTFIELLAVFLGKADRLLDWVWLGQLLLVITERAVLETSEANVCKFVPACTRLWAVMWAVFAVCYFCYNSSWLLRVIEGRS